MLLMTLCPATVLTLQEHRQPTRRMRLALLVISLLAVAWADKHLCPKYVQRDWGEVVSHHPAYLHTLQTLKARMPTHTIDTRNLQYPIHT